MPYVHTSRNHSDEPHLYIGRVAQFTGASRKAIRYYESIGLLPPVARRGQYRVYSERDVFLVHMIKHTQSYGFSLAELKKLVAAKARSRGFPLKLAEAMVARKRIALRQQIADIRALDKRLVQLTRDMRRHFG
jgi:MerR family transcriptional regulator, copper efflux regulator